MSAADSSTSSSSSSTASVDRLILKLHDIGAFKTGSFKLKSGIMSPIYIDLRVIVSYPDVLAMVAEAMIAVTAHTSFDVICGVPYTGPSRLVTSKSTRRARVHAERARTNPSRNNARRF